jgi:hypothetical protein
LLDHGHRRHRAGPGLICAKAAATWRVGARALGRVIGHCPKRIQCPG